MHAAASNISFSTVLSLIGLKFVGDIQRDVKMPLRKGDLIDENLLLRLGFGQLGALGAAKKTFLEKNFGESPVLAFSIYWGNFLFSQSELVSFC